MLNNYECCEWVMIIIAVVLTAILLDSTRVIDEHGMDAYDRRSYIAGDGYTRNAFGQIYKDGYYDVWANIWDHNPFYAH
jgi:hypothetical protein